MYFFDEPATSPIAALRLDIKRRGMLGLIYANDKLAGADRRGR